MPFLTTKSLPRRTVLRGLGATMALPFLEAMVPALSHAGAAAAKPGASVLRVLRAQRDGHGVLVTKG